MDDCGDGDGDGDGVWGLGYYIKEVKTKSYVRFGLLTVDADDGKRLKCERAATR